MEDSAHEKPFRCSRRKEFYRDLKGAFFDILEDISALDNAYCVWAGKGCSFDGELKFLADTAVGSKHGVNASYQFIVGGLLFIQSDRYDPGTFPSAALLYDQLQVLGPHQASSFRDSWDVIWKPFTWKAWVFVFMCIMGHGFARFWMSFHFTVYSTRGFSWRQLRARLLGQYYPETSLQDENEENWKHMEAMWSLIAKLFVAIMLVLWEVAIAVNVFERKNDAQLGPFDASKFAITKNTTMARKFKSLVPLGKFKTYENLDAVYEAIANTSNRFDYTLSYKIMNSYMLHRNGSICEKTRVYEKFPEKYNLPHNPPSYTGVWFYSSNINSSRMVQINQEIFDLREEGTISKHVQKYAIPKKCLSKSENDRIDWTLIFLLLLILPGLPFALFFCCMVYCTFSSRNRSRFVVQDAKYEEFSQPNTSNDSLTTLTTDTHAHFEQALMLSKIRRCNQ